VEGPVTVIQETVDPKTTRVAGDAVATLDTALVSGRSWSVVVAQTVGTSAETVYFNGVASCYATTQLVS
jgi:hypothetical protein